MEKEVITTGHLPPPITGENLCRKQLEEALLEAGFNVTQYSRVISMGLLLAKASRVVIVSRQSLFGSASDYILMCWFLIRRKQVWLYFHNRSWRRYAHFPFAIMARTLANGCLKMLVLTRNIETSLREAGHSVSVLNNSGGEVFDQIAASPSPPANRRLLWLGRPDEAKGFIFALEVFRCLRRSDESWVFDVYGATGNGLPQLPGLVYHGFVHGQEKLKAFAHGGVFILPSNYANETQPLSIIEALAAGLPVVASDIGGIPDMLAEGEMKAGVILNTRETDAYIKAITGCIDKYAELSAVAKEIYRRKYSRRVFCRAVVAEFSQE